VRLKRGRDLDIATAPLIPSASPPIFDAFGLWVTNVRFAQQSLEN
jgi:hypothetical protein